MRTRTLARNSLHIGQIIVRCRPGIGIVVRRLVMLGERRPDDFGHRSGPAERGQVVEVGPALLGLEKHRHGDRSADQFRDIRCLGQTRVAQKWTPDLGPRA